MLYKKFDKNGYEIRGWDYFNTTCWRLLSIPLARKLSKTRIKPEQIVFLSFLSGILSTVSFSLNSNYGSVFGSVFFAIFWFLDHVDGDLARMKSQTSNLGEWLDCLCGKLITVLVYFSIFINLSRTHEPRQIWTMGYLLLSAYYLFGMLGKTTDKIRRSCSSKREDVGKKIDVRERGLLKTVLHELAGGHNILFWILIIGGMSNQLYRTIIISTLYAIFYTFLYFYSSYKEIKNLEG